MVRFLTRAFALAALLFAGAAGAAEPLAQWGSPEAAGNPQTITDFKCSQALDGKPGYLCWYRADNTDAAGAYARIGQGGLAGACLERLLARHTEKPSPFYEGGALWRTTRD